MNNFLYVSKNFICKGLNETFTNNSLRDWPNSFGAKRVLTNCKKKKKNRIKINKNKKKYQDTESTDNC